MRRLGLPITLLLAVLYLSSCATVPPAYSPAGWLALLPPESTVFVAADVPAARGLLEAAAQRGLPGEQQGGLSAERLRGVLDRTHRLYAAVSLLPGVRPSFSLVALGAFNPGAVSCRLGVESDWQRHRLDKTRDGDGLAGSARARTYWEHRRLALELAAPRAGLVLVANGGMVRMLHRLQRLDSGGPSGSLTIPAEALETLEQAALFAYLPSLPTAAGSGGQEGPGTAPAPIRELWFAAVADPAAPGTYVAEAVFRLEEAKNPRLLENLFRLLLAAWLRRSGLEDPVGRLKGAEIVAGGRDVRVRGLALSGDDILLLLGGVLPAPPE
jgi:hypothetical protein